MNDYGETERILSELRAHKFDEEADTLNGKLDRLRAKVDALLGRKDPAAIEGSVRIGLTVSEADWVILRRALDGVASSADADVPAPVRERAGELRDSVQLQGHWDWSHTWEWRDDV